MTQLTIDIPEDLKADLEKIAGEQGTSVSEYVRCAIAGQVYARQLREMRKTLGPRAEAAGFHNEQDVFDAIS